MTNDDSSAVLEQAVADAQQPPDPELVKEAPSSDESAPASGPAPLSEKQKQFILRQNAVKSAAQQRAIKQHLITLRDPINVYQAFFMKPIDVAKFQRELMVLMRSEIYSRIACMSLSPVTETGSVVLRCHVELPTLVDKQYTSGTPEKPTYAEVGPFEITNCSTNFPGAVVLRDGTMAAGDPKPFFVKSFTQYAMKMLKANGRSRQIRRKLGIA